MPWAKVDDRLHAHIKWRRAKKGARALWTTALSWCSGQGNGGHVPADILRSLDGTKSEAEDLVRVGLWTKVDDGYVFHEWDERNPDASTAKVSRQVKAQAGTLGAHNRWHVKRDIVDPDCGFCAWQTDSKVPSVSYGNPNAPVPDPYPYPSTTGSNTPTDRRTGAAMDGGPELQNVPAVLASHGLARNDMRDFLAHIRQGGARNPNGLISALHRSGELKGRIEEWRLTAEADALAASRPRSGKRTTDDRVHDAMALAEKFRAEESGAPQIEGGT